MVTICLEIRENWRSLKSQRVFHHDYSSRNHIIIIPLPQTRSCGTCDFNDLWKCHGCHSDLGWEIRLLDALANLVTARKTGNLLQSLSEILRYASLSRSVGDVYGSFEKLRNGFFAQLLCELSTLFDFSIPKMHQTHISYDIFLTTLGTKFKHCLCHCSSWVMCAWADDTGFYLQVLLKQINNEK